MLTADLNYRYFGELAVRFQSRDRCAKFLMAATSSTSVSGWMIWGRPGWDWAWQALSGLTAVVAIALPVLDLPKSLRTSGTLHGRWFSIRSDYELLWARLDSLTDPDVCSKWKTIAEEEKRLVELESTIRTRNDLVLHCYDEVCKSRGLSVV